MGSKPKGRAVSRRGFLKKCAAAGSVAAVAGLPGIRRAARAGTPAIEKLNIAFIGSGGQAAFSLGELVAQGQNIVALCDVDERRAAEAFKAHPKARKYADFRKMLDEMDKQIDAVVVCTPDHMHAPASLRAMRMGKHVYCEKPLCWSIGEARLMAETARKHKVATQMGTQGMAEDRSRAGVEMLRSGVLGAVREMHVWTDRAEGWWPQGVGRPSDKQAVPKGLDWHLWLGVAPQRPYHKAYLPFTWRGWKDFGTGAIGDMGIHNAAMPWLGLRLGLPTSVEVANISEPQSQPQTQPQSNAETWPAWSILRFEFPARGQQPPVTMHWYDGRKKPPAALLPAGRKIADNGAIVVGENGTLYSIEWTGGDWHLLPAAKFRSQTAPAATLPRSGGGHHKEWVAACKGGPAAFCNFIDFAAPLSEVMLLGCLAQRLGRKIEWDAANMKATNCPEADAFIRRQYRKGWEL